MDKPERRNGTTGADPNAEYRGALTDLAVGIGAAAIYDAGKAGVQHLKAKASGSQGDKQKD